ncbi:phytanoyl-CoA dioxygenase family protein [Heterostelium album PN500]|uniref:Phytanoyl-CoA dioxygenase family protein n=1 Tax=Heterostelium pallidum (strain ATCC 26659 / Pp 5 / PN500) TaxID=670386 RepID=D3B8A0_HETP5|nr:phytanoyl-CoA dioxygenase family protein [Heterostelium album PN500]EFA82268.1 phytanoyl-CoA dioxygenase family protein [Heterostelium album PN500]|eukprot:XP_020434385.1 phytanoyl-CoA dioxygenase family protein [Heterostelium album PN500]
MMNKSDRYFISKENIGDSEYRQFHEDGFVFIKDVISGDEVKNLHSRVAPLFDGKFETGIYPDEWYWRKGLSRDDITREMVNAWKCDRSFATIALHEKMGAIAAKLMGWRGARLAQDDIFWKPTTGKPIGFHQDQPYFNFFTPSEVVTIWVALTNVSMHNGTLEYVKGSHRWPVTHSHSDAGFHAPDDYLAKLNEAAKKVNLSDSYERVSCDFSAGSCSVHHGMMWHGSATNPSPTVERVSMALHYISSESQFNEQVQAGYIYGRYKIFGSSRLEESFFPIVYRDDGYRSECIKSFTTTTTTT